MPAAQSGLETTERYPWWSGVFNEFEGDHEAIMLIHDADDRYHRPPSGWALVAIERPVDIVRQARDAANAQAETTILAEAEAYFYSRSCAQ